MSDKRPWSPGPWQIEDITAFTPDSILLDTKENYELASKSPEMAELLIQLINLFKTEYDWEDLGREVERIVVLKSEKLLEEIGYDPNKD
jgi:hypothetical protein